MTNADTVNAFSKMATEFASRARRSVVFLENIDNDPVVLKDGMTNEIEGWIVDELPSDTSDISVCYMRALNGAQFGLHTHNSHETLHVLHGALKITKEDDIGLNITKKDNMNATRSYVLGAGDSLEIRAGQKHWKQAIGKAVVVAVYRPPLTEYKFTEV